MKSGYDLSRPIKFTLREDWRDALEDTMADHLPNVVARHRIDG